MNNLAASGGKNETLIDERFLRVITGIHARMNGEVLADGEKGRTKQICRSRCRY